MGKSISLSWTRVSIHWIRWQWLSVDNTLIFLECNNPHSNFLTAIPECAPLRCFHVTTTSLFRHNLVERLVDARPFDVVGRFLHNLLKGLRYTCD